MVTIEEIPVNKLGTSSVHETALHVHYDHACISILYMTHFIHLAWGGHFAKTVEAGLFVVHAW